MEIPTNLKLQNSKIHGSGIFAITPLDVEEVLGEFTGEIMLKTKFTELYGKDIRYTYWNKHNFKTTTVIVAKNPRNFITYINEAIIPNVKLVKKKLIVVRNIGVDEELFLLYSNDYPRDYIVL